MTHKGNFDKGDNMDKELELIQNAIHCLKVGADLEICENCNLYECTHTDVSDIARVAIKALEKQIPKNIVSEGDDESDWVYCPCCNEILGTNESVFDYFYDNNWKPIYCNECGQSLILK